MRNVIVQFSTFGERDRWVESLALDVHRYYKRAPWFAASLTEAQYATLAKQQGIKIFADTKLVPLHQEGR